MVEFFHRAPKIGPSAGAANDLDEKAQAIENQLLQKTTAEGDLKSFRGPLQLYLKLVWLGAEAGSGGADVSGNSDFAPTKPEVEVFDLLHQRLQKVSSEFNDFYAKQVPEFNQSMSGKGLMRIMPVKVE